MKRIGILGGTFNPIHNAHIMLAETAYSFLGLDKVLFMPSKNPPHKDRSVIVSEQERSCMIKAAIASREYFEFSDVELKREGTTYTSDTLRILHQLYPDTNFFFIIGGDSLKDFTKWHEPAEILGLCTLVCTGRSEYADEKVHDDINRIRSIYSHDGFCPQLIYLPTPSMDISSTVIRDKVSFGMSVRALLPDSVIEFINEHKLYQNGLFEQIIEDMKQTLSPHRFAHVLNVAETAVHIAQANGADIKKAYLAGLLHDCTKYLDAQEQFDVINSHNIPIDAVEERCPNQLLHAKTGAIWAKEKYGIDDEDIVNAIFYHTSGRPDMSLLEKVIFIADYIEPLRNMSTEPALDVIRSYAYTDPDYTIVLILKNTLDYLRASSPDNIMMLSVDTYDFYRKQLHLI